ncbi:unnamed protein product, partial [Mesorhabditis belari]|uniref:Uncharacterized protein n=1 Tax=Mesorhabditis belari TaxID=2138241 RepID=A0AAF3EMZ5_9BILA
MNSEKHSGNSLVLISFHFFYRYCLICRTSWLIMFNRWKYLPIWVSIWAFMGLCCASFLHFFMYHTPEFQAYFRDILWETYHFDVNTTAILGPLYKQCRRNPEDCNTSSSEHSLFRRSFQQSSSTFHSL